MIRGIDTAPLDGEEFRALRDRALRFDPYRVIGALIMAAPDLVRATVQRLEDYDAAQTTATSEVRR